MNTRMIRGKMPLPTSLPQAKFRAQELGQAIERTEKQIADPLRITKYTDTADYDAWRLSAGRALKLFRAEQRQLSEWIAIAENSSETLLRQAYDVLSTLRDDDVDFEPQELELIERLDAHFNTKVGELYDAQAKT